MLVVYWDEINCFGMQEKIVKMLYIKKYMLKKWCVVCKDLYGEVVNEIDNVDGYR